MAYLPLKLPPGIERNNSPYDTPNRWWDMSQTRWQSGTVMPIGGWQRTTGTPLDTPSRAFEVWRDNTAARQVLVGTDHKLYVDSSGSYVDITPVGFQGPGSVLPTGGYGTGAYGTGAYGTPRGTPSPIFSPYGYWSFDQWGQDILFTANSDGHLYYYPIATPTTAPTVVSTAPAGANGCLVTAERHAMLIGYSGNPRGIAWSSSEDYTDWNFASTTNTAGNLTLVSRTPLLKGMRVAEGVLIHSYTDVFLIRYIQQPYIYGGQDPIADTSLFNPASVVRFGGKAMWPARIGFQLYAGGYVQVIDCPVLEDILGSAPNADPAIAMDPTWGPFRIHGGHNFRFPELWWFYPSVGNTECNRYVLYNYVEGWWAWGALSRSAMSAADAYQYPYMGGTDGNIYEHERGFLANGTSRVGQVFVESGALGLGASDRTMDIQGGLIATGSGYQSVNLTVKGRMTPEGVEFVTGPKLIRPDGYIDVRCSYRDSRVRFEMIQDGNFSLGTIKLDAQPGSGR